MRNCARAPAAKLHQAELALAKDYGFASWRALKARVDALSLDGQVVAAAAAGKARELARRLAAHPRKLAVTGGRWNRPKRSGGRGDGRHPARAIDDKPTKPVPLARNML